MILVLGASSYVGRHVFQSLRSQGAMGTYWSNPVPGCVRFDATTMHLPDILPQDAGISHAVILYAEAGIDQCKADQARSYRINVSSTERLIDDLVKRDIKPVFTSSEYVFDGERGNYLEEDPANPTTVYGTQKLEVEGYLAEHCEAYAVLRLAKVFGTDPEDKTILSSWLRQINDGQDIKCASDQVFSPIHVDDVVGMIRAVIAQDLSGVYHVANLQPWSRLGMLRALIEASGSQANVIECSIKDFDFLDHRPLDLSMDPAKMVAATGLKPKSVESSCLELLGKASPIVQKQIKV